MYKAYVLYYGVFGPLNQANSLNKAYRSNLASYWTPFADTKITKQRFRHQKQKKTQKSHKKWKHIYLLSKKLDQVVMPAKAPNPETRSYAGFPPSRE
jgi:hypothetical protein